MTNEITINDLIEMGMSLEDIVSKKRPPEIQVNLDPTEFSNILDKVSQDNALMLGKIQELLIKDQAQSKTFLNKTLQLLAKQVQQSGKTDKPIKKIKVVRNKKNLIDSLELVR